MRRVRDSQRSAVYRWERECAKRWPDLLSHNMTPGEIRALVARVWSDYRGSEKGMPEIRIATPSARGGAWANRFRMRIPAWGRRPWVVLHETAHSLLAGAPGGQPDGAHGPTFARLLLELFERYAGVPLAEAKSIGVNLTRDPFNATRRVHFARAAATPSPESRAMRSWRKEHARLSAAVVEAQRLLTEHNGRRPER